MAKTFFYVFYTSVRIVEVFMFINNNFNRYNIGFKQNIGNNIGNNYNVQTSSAPQPKTQSPYQNGEVRTRNLYANDLHGILKGYRKLITVKERFDAESKNNPDIVYSTYLSGDGSVGANRPKNNLIILLENFINARAKTPGNHEFDDEGSQGLSKLMDNSKVKTLALNLVTAPNSSLQDDIDAGRLAKSMIFEENGQKFGVIGLIPSDLYMRINQQSKDKSKDIDVLNLSDTIKALQQEVNKMEAQGVNKITVLSHMGYDADIAIAKAVNGVDIIHGAHSHDLLKGLQPNVNYFLSQRGEPIIITQASKNGHWYGILDVVYDKNGKIINASNDVKSLDAEKDSLKAVLAERMMIGHPVKIGNLVHEVKSMSEAVLDESPMCSFLCDAYKEYTGADIVLNNAGTMRNTLQQGDVTDRVIIDMMPYYNNISTYRLSEKDILTAINNGIEATKKYHRTGALQVAGMSYIIGHDGKIKEAYLLKDDGTKEPMNVQNPREDKFYTVAYNSFLSGGTEGLEILHAPEKLIKTFDQNETDLLIDYFKSFNNKPLSIDKTGRISHENNPESNPKTRVVKREQQ